MDSKQLAQRTLTRLTRTPIDWHEAIARRSDETDTAYADRMQALADGSAGAIRLIIVNRIAQRTDPAALDSPTDLTPLSRHVIPIILA